MLNKQLPYGEYLGKRDEEFDGVGDEPRHVADEEDCDDDGGRAGDADGARVGHAARPADDVAAQRGAAAGGLAAAELQVDERVEDGEHADGRHEVHEEVEEVHVHLRRDRTERGLTTRTAVPF